MSFLDFLGNLKPYVSPANIAKRILFSEEGVTPGAGPLAQGFSLSGQTVINNFFRSQSQESTFNDYKDVKVGLATPLVYPQDLFSTTDSFFDPCILFHMKEPVFRDNKILKRIALYMPPNVSVNYGANWSDVDLLVSKNNIEAVKGVAENTIRDIASMSDGKGFKTNLVDAANAAFNTLTQTTARGYAKQALSSSIGQAASAITGKTLNPMAGLAFQSVNFREFSFTFELLARTQNESNIINDIIGTFKYGMHPDPVQANTKIKTVDDTISSVLMEYPKTFDIFLFAGGHSKYLFNFERCVLTNVQVNYNNGDHASFFGNGAPVNIGLTLSFKETELLTRQRISYGD